MANPQPTDAHLRMAHSIHEQLMVSVFSSRQRRILDLILRLSWGCGKKEAVIPRQKDFEIVGVLEGHVRIEIDWLVESQVIWRDGPRYGFNKDFDNWRVSRAKAYKPDELTKLVRLNLNGKAPNLPKREEMEGVEGGATYQKGKKPLTEKVSSTDTESATPKEKERNNKYRDIIKGLFDYWNSLGIIRHRKITTRIEAAVVKALKDYDVYEISAAMGHYAEILHGNYNWTYIWTMEDFLVRGITKFLDLNVAKRNYAQRPDGKQPTGKLHDRDKYVMGRMGHLVKRRLEE